MLSLPTSAWLIAGTRQGPKRRAFSGPEPTNQPLAFVFLRGLFSFPSPLSSPSPLFFHLC